MSYAELSSQLKSLAKRVASHEFADNKLSKSAVALQNAAARFSDELEGINPVLERLKSLIGSPSAKKHFDIDGLKSLSKTVLGKSLPLKPEESVGAFRKRLLAIIAERGLEAEAESAARARLSQTPPPPSLKDEDALLAELYRLGGLDAEALQGEMKNRLRDKKMILALAGAARLRISETAPLDKIRNDVLRFAKRAHQNL